MAPHSREIDPENGPNSRLAFNTDVAAVLFDDSIYRGKAQSGPFALCFGGEERLQNVRLYLFLDTPAPIAHTKHHVSAGRTISLPACTLLREVDVGEPQ